MEARVIKVHNFGTLVMVSLVKLRMAVGRKDHRFPVLASAT
jgi:hypothetical protein